MVQTFHLIRHVVLFDETSSYHLMETSVNLANLVVELISKNLPSYCHLMNPSQHPLIPNPSTRLLSNTHPESVNTPPHISQI